MGTTTASPARLSRWWWPAAALAIGIAAYSLRYVVLGARAYTPELAASFSERPMVIAIHALFGPIALLCGLVQLTPALRNRRWFAHRTIGRVYVVSALMLAGAGLALSPHAAGGLIARTGFALLALATLGTTLVAYGRIRRGDIRAHREWMLRSYGCIFAAVTLRIWMPLLMLADGGAFIPAYRVVAWLSWVPNLLWAERIIRRGWTPSFTLDERASPRIAETI